MMLMLVQLSSYQHVTLVICKRNQKGMLEHQSYYLERLGGFTYCQISRHSRQNRRAMLLRIRWSRHVKRLVQGCHIL